MSDLSTIRSEALGAVEQAADLAALDAARVAALGKKGSVTGLMKTLGGMSPEQRREFGAQVNQLKGEIEFRNVRFHYPGRDDMALDGVSFRIAPGERVALIGRVGSGKSTILRLMMGLYEPTDGAVLLDGIDLRQLDPADVRRGVGCVSQDVLLFYGSMRENITLADAIVRLKSEFADHPQISAMVTFAAASKLGLARPRMFRNEVEV